MPIDRCPKIDWPAAKQIKLVSNGRICPIDGRLHQSGKALRGCVGERLRIRREDSQGSNNLAQNRLNTDASLTALDTGSDMRIDRTSCSTKRADVGVL